MKKLSICIVSDADSWITPYVEKLAEELQAMEHNVICRHDFDVKRAYDLCFLLSFSKIISARNLQRNKHNLVVHESALPKGKGWSPLTWQILEGKNCIPITLFEATAKVDAGQIYLQEKMHFKGTELVQDLRHVQGTMTQRLCLEFVRRYPAILQTAKAQDGEATFYPRRRPADSCMDLDKPLRTQINLLRVVDNERYPAFFDYEGERYYLAIYQRKA